MTTKLTLTTTAAQTNRLIAQMKEDGTLSTEALAILNLRAINQVRATQGKKPLSEYRPSLVKAIVKTVPTFTPAASIKPLERVKGVDPLISRTVKVISTPTAELTALTTKLNACPDRSSAEARKIRKQIRSLKDRLGIAR